jgi:hypothetical protein
MNNLGLSILSDGFQKTIKFVQTQEEDKFISKEQLNDFCANIVQRYPLFFEEYSSGSTPMVRQFGCQLSLSALYKSSKQQTTMDIALRVYDLYMFYSKYDHVSAFSLDFLRLPKEQKDERLCDSIKYLLMQSRMLHKLLNGSYENNDFISVQLEKIQLFKQI